jgi:endoglucanase
LLAVTACSSQGALVKDPSVPEDATASLRSTYFGAFTYGGVWHGMEPVYALEQELGRRLDIVHWFTNWDNPFDPTMVAAASSGGRIPLISWQPQSQTVDDIATGVYDDYLRAWADGARTLGTEIYLRPFPEMNGSWVPWNGEPATLVRAWRHMVDLFREHGATNVRWVWSPNIRDEPATPGNAMESYYPGDTYVDVLGLDGYNWGTTRSWSSWRSFEQVFASAYQRITAIGPQPLWLTELASTDAGGDKSTWVRDMFSTTAFPRVQALVWFNQNKESDWRINSSPQVADAFRDGLAGGAALASR